MDSNTLIFRTCAEATAVEVEIVTGAPNSLIRNPLI